MAFAIIQTGGKQYKVSAGQKIRISKIEAENEAVLNFDKVLLVGDGDNVKIGAPYVEGVKVEAIILRQSRDKKKIVFKYKQKTRRMKKKGHRQHFTEVEIGKINF